MTRLRADLPGMPPHGLPGMGTLDPVPLRGWKRPDGRFYRPYRVVVERWESRTDPFGPWSSRGAVVLGTFDFAAAYEWADRLCRSLYGRGAEWESGVDRWARSGYAGRRGEVSWVEDSARGRAAVFFSVAERVW